jgi:hypothetical protein
MEWSVIDPQNGNTVRATNGSPGSLTQAFLECCIRFLTINKVAGRLRVPSVL